MSNRAELKRVLLSVEGKGLDVVLDELLSWHEQEIAEARISELASADIAMDSSGINETEEWESYYNQRIDQLRGETK